MKGAITMARHKVLDINTDGVNLYCTFDDTEKTSNPYRLYRRWYEYRGDRNYGWHRKQMGQYNSLYNVICFVKAYCEQTGAGYTDTWSVSDK